MTNDEHGPERIPPTDAPVSDRTAPPSRWRMALVGGAALALVAGGVATSLAASPAPSNTPTAPAAGALAPDPDLGLEDDGTLDHGRMEGRGFRDITITAISGSDVTLGTDDGWRRTISVTDAIDLTKGGQDVGLGDLKVGDQVRFAQTRNADGTYTVTKLAIVVPTVRGTVSDVTADGFKVTTRDGSVWTIATNGTTTYRFGTDTGTRADVTAGEGAIVAGTSTGANQLTALTVQVAGDRAVGTVTAKTADSITIKRRDGSSLTIHVDADTTYRVAGSTTAGLADVTVDMAIGVSGRARADGSIDAATVVAGNGRGFGLGGGGFDGPGGGGRGHGRFDGLPAPDAPTDTAPTT